MTLPFEEVKKGLADLGAQHRALDCILSGSGLSELERHARKRAAGPMRLDPGRTLELAPQVVDGRALKPRDVHL